MIVINYVKPNIVISGDYLFSGKLNVYHNDKVVHSREIHNENSINLDTRLDGFTSIRIEVITQKETVSKRINF